MINNLRKTQNDVKKIEKFLINGQLDEFGESMKEHWLRKKRDQI